MSSSRTSLFFLTGLYFNNLIKEVYNQQFNTLIISKQYRVYQFRINHLHKNNLTFRSAVPTSPRRNHQWMTHPLFKNYSTYNCKSKPLKLEKIWSGVLESSTKTYCPVNGPIKSHVKVFWNLTNFIVNDRPLRHKYFV